MPHMPQLQGNGSLKCYIKYLFMFNGIIKVSVVRFHGNKLIVKKAKTPPRTICSNNLLGALIRQNLFQISLLQNQPTQLNQVQINR